MALIFDSLPDFWAQRSQHWALWLQEVAASEGKRLGDFNYRFHTDDELLELNRRFLDHDTYTDIITFDRTRGNRIAADVAVSWETIAISRASASDSPAFEDAFLSRSVKLAPTP